MANPLASLARALTVMRLRGKPATAKLPAERRDPAPTAATGTARAARGEGPAPQSTAEGSGGLHYLHVVTAFVCAGAAHRRDMHAGLCIGCNGTASCVLCAHAMDVCVTLRAVFGVT